MKKNNSSGGLIQLAILFGIFCVIVWYFNIDIKGYIDGHPEIRKSLLQMIAAIQDLWKNYLAGAGTYIWNHIVIDIIWKGITGLILK